MTLKIDDIRMVWQTGSIQQAVMVITFAFTLLIPLQYAVLVGVALAFLFVVDGCAKAGVHALDVEQVSVLLTLAA